MGALGTSVQKSVNAIINNSSIRSSITITQLTKNSGSYGGYQATADTESSVNTYGVPVEYVKKIDLLQFGSLSHGSTGVVIKASETIQEDTYDYQVTWQGTDWQLKSVDRPNINDVIACQILSLVKDV